MSKEQTIFDALKTMPEPDEDFGDFREGGTSTWIRGNRRLEVSDVGHINGQDRYVTRYVDDKIIGVREEHIEFENGARLAELWDWMKFIVHAQIGYQAYGDKANWKAYDGKPMPKWNELPEHIQMKWCAAAKAIVINSAFAPQELHNQRLLSES